MTTPNHEDAGKVGVAFLMVGIGSVSTLFGAALVFTPFLDLRKTNGGGQAKAQLGRGQKLALSFALAFAAGVMIILSLTEILAHTYESFNGVESLNPTAAATTDAAGRDPSDPHFGHNHRRLHDGAHAGHNHGGAETGAVSVVSMLIFVGGFCLMGLINMCASGLRRLAALFNKSAPSHTHDVESAMDDIQDTGAVVANVEVKSSNGMYLHAPDARAVEQPNNAQLLISGLLTAVAIALHNFPEGIVVFVGGLASPTIGAALCFATIVHNVPEGICIALPVCYGVADMMKGKSEVEQEKESARNAAVAYLSRTCCSIPRWSGFAAATLSTLAEAAGGVIGYLALLIAGNAHSTDFSGIVQGTLFGATGGIMVFVSVNDLLPLAHTYASMGGAVSGGYMSTLGFMCGMGAMCASVVALSAPNDTVVIVAVALGIAAVAVVTVVSLILACVEGRRHHHHAVSTTSDDDAALSASAVGAQRQSEEIELETVTNGEQPKTAAV
jgi:zinc transporter ZupT